MLRVLIAEDELIIAYVMRSQLQQRGIEVVGLAATGSLAVELCRQSRPDVVLMDVRMPQTDGIEATRRIMERCPTCVIMVTAYADELTVAKAEAAGAMGFLSKPIQAAGVLEALPKARARFAEFQLIRAEACDLEEALQTRCLVEQAKALLAAQGPAQIASAFEALRERAKSSGLPLKATAQHLLELGPGFSDHDPRP
jgi:response regulator NasT